MKTTKECAMADMATIVSVSGRDVLLGYTTYEAMYNAVVYHRRWWRRFWRWFV